jgi:carboxymethylenebutenolidase
MIMKYVILFSCILMSFITNAQNCCAPTTTEQYAMNGAKAAFRNAHDEPLPYKHHSVDGKDISFKTPDGTDGHGWLLPAKSNSDYYLFVIHEWWGLNDHIKKESEKMWNDFGFNVIALDLYDQKVATTREEAGAVMQALKTERAVSIIQGALNYAGKSAKIFTIGWCFGGGWSLQTGLLAGPQLAGTIMFYGQPEKDIDKLKTLNADVIGFFGNRDQWPSPAMVDEFRDNMQKAGKTLLLNRYEADHAFANPSNPKFDKAATEDSYKKLSAFIRERMK